MPKRKYKQISFQSKSLDLIELVNSVIEEYSAQGSSIRLLTLIELGIPANQPFTSMRPADYDTLDNVV